jgi:hypothetical protein
MWRVYSQPWKRRSRAEKNECRYGVEGNTNAKAGDVMMRDGEAPWHCLSFALLQVVSRDLACLTYNQGPVVLGTPRLEATMI